MLPTVTVGWVAHTQCLRRPCCQPAVQSRAVTVNTAPAQGTSQRLYGARGTGGNDVREVVGKQRRPGTRPSQDALGFPWTSVCN